MSASPEELRLEMARIRAGARGKAFLLKEETKQLLDWKHYVRLFPWGILGSALLAGYLLVPTRRSASRTVAEPPPERADRQAPEPVEQTVKRAGLVTAALGFVGTVAYRAALNYVTRQVIQNFVAPHSPSEPAEKEAVHEYRRPSFF